MTTAPRVAPYWTAAQAAERLDITRCELFQILRKHGAIWKDTQGHYHVEPKWREHLRAQHRVHTIGPDRNGRGIPRHYTALLVTETGMALLHQLLEAANEEP